MPFSCSICEEESTRICVQCTKDTCSNHLCEKCGACSDCCDCEIPLDDMRHIETVHPEPVIAQPAEPAAEQAEEPMTAEILEPAEPAAVQAEEPTTAEILEPAGVSSADPLAGPPPDPKPEPPHPPPDPDPFPIDEPEPEPGPVIKEP